MRSRSTAQVLIYIAVLVPPIGYAQEASPRSLYNDAGKAYDSGKVPEAIKLYKEFLRKVPGSVQARTNLGVALVHEGRYGEAIVQYKEALKTDPKNPTLRLDLALAWYKQADFVKAAYELTELHQQQAENQQILYLLADCYLRLGRYRDLIALLEPVYQAHPDDAGVDYALGTALIQDGEAQKGEAVVSQIVKTGHAAEATLLTGASHYAAGNFKDAVATVRHALEMNPNLPGGWTLLGRALLGSGDNEGAKSAFQRALSSDRNDFEANLYLGGILRHDGENDSAAPYLNRARGLRPDSSAAKFQVGALNLAMGNLEKSRIELESVARQSPDFLEVHVELATLYAKLKRPLDSERERKIVLALNAKARREGPQPEQ